MDTAEAVEEMDFGDQQVMSRLLNESTDAALAEAEKLYASVFEAPLSFLFLASPKHGPAAARAMLLQLQGQDNGVTIFDADLGYADDDADWIRNLYQDDPEFDHWFGQLRFGRAFADIKRLARERPGDWWGDFPRRLPRLHRSLAF